jgi:Cu-processing system ATP-binding protein
MDENVISLDRVSKQYRDVRALDEVSLAVPRAQRVALIGHNGAGKSTLIKLMLGLIRPTGGKVVVLGAEATGAGFIEARRAIGFLPESIVFPDGMTGVEVLDFYARLKRQPVSKNAGLFERVGLAQAARRRVGTYSKGMRQRLGLAQALIGHPRLLLLDEPTSGLDPSLRKEVYGIIGELARNGATVLLSSHALAEIEPEVDRVVALIRGRKVADSTMVGLRQASAALARIQVRLPEGCELPDAALVCAASHERRGDGVTEIRCRESEKLPILRRLLAEPSALADVEVIPATLEDIYAGILRREEAR